jgi:hypothetical protein
VKFDVTFTTPFTLAADHYVFVPQAGCWLRVGTDITNQGPFNDAFSLQGALVPEPSTWAMMVIGFAGLGYATSAELENRVSRCK